MMKRRNSILVVSDVDGTLVNSLKQLSLRNRQAALRLGAHGIQFTIISSRPPFGLKPLVEPLCLRLPMASLNGGVLAMPNLKVVTRQPLGAAAALKTLALFDEFGVDTWLFTETAWYVTDSAAPYVAKETHTLQTPPEVVDSLAPLLGQAIKLVGVSDDFDRLARCAMQAELVLGGAAAVSRSQLYYLDITAPGIDKGSAVVELARRCGVDLADVISIGDMDNDVPMFRRTGFSIAMGNGSAAAKTAASATTGTNNADGFADAVEQLILPRVATMAQAV